MHKYTKMQIAIEYTNEKYKYAKQEDHNMSSPGVNRINLFDFFQNFGTKSDFRDLSPFKHLIKVMKRQKDKQKEN